VSILLSAKNLKKAFGVRPLFDGLTFVVESGERVGLIGPNGAGKSTLLRILSDELPSDGGEVSYQKGLKIGFLEQTPTLPLDLTVEDAIHREPTPLTGEILSRLELTSLSYVKVGTLSGGWKKRVALARELVKGPELLLLDEPTNHLDIESILWLEDFLSRSSFATVTVTHDRVFLQRVTNRILELDRRNPQGLLNIRGDYGTYVQRKEELLATQEKQETVLKNTLRREMEWLRRGAKARTTKQQARIQATERLQDEVQELETRNQTRTTRIDFQSSEKKPKRLIEAKSITRRINDRDLFRDLNLFLGPGDRVGLLGANGSGKSTLIRVLIGQEEPDSGTVLRSEHLKVAYFEQNRETLDPTQSLKKTVCPHGDHVNYRGKMVHVQGYLDRFLFQREQSDVQIGKLSGGEQSRVLLALLMLKEANVLVLDEPTNDLDVETLDVLQDCLLDFDGAVLLVTHDRYFLDQVAKQIYAFPTTPEEKGNIVTFAGLDQWENWRKERNSSKKLAKTEAKSADAQKKKKLSFNEVRELEAMEGKIHAAEAKLAQLEKESQLPDNISNGKRLSEIFKEMADTQALIEKLYARWSELEAIKSS
jgi:ABC transport system ATP-binding/permease protein